MYWDYVKLMLPFVATGLYIVMVEYAVVKMNKLAHLTRYFMYPIVPVVLIVTYVAMYANLTGMVQQWFVGFIVAGILLSNPVSMAFFLMLRNAAIMEGVKITLTPRQAKRAMKGRKLRTRRKIRR